MSNALDKTADIIDIREVIERFEELESDRDGFVIGSPDGEETPAPEQWAEENPEDAEELAHLESFLDEVRGYGGDEQWRGHWYPLTFINDDHFVEAMEELVKDIGGLPEDIPNYLAIDWDATAENLRVDYSSVEIDGQTFWYR